MQNREKGKKPKKMNDDPTAYQQPNFSNKNELRSSITMFEALKSSLSELKNRNVLNVLKLVYMQKHSLREEVYLILKDKLKFRKKRGGIRIKRKLDYVRKRHERKVNNTTTSVLKLMMFEETRPELLPVNIKQKIDKAGSKDREECCSVY